MTRRTAASLSLVLSVACASAPEPNAPEPMTAALTEIEISVKESEPRPAFTAAVKSVPPPPLSLCDQYFAKLEACNFVALNSMPPGPGRDSAERAMSDAITAVRESFSTIEDKETLDTVCKTVIDALSQNPNCPK